MGLMIQTLRQQWSEAVARALSNMSVLAVLIMNSIDVCGAMSIVLSPVLQRQVQPGQDERDRSLDNGEQAK